MRLWKYHNLQYVYKKGGCVYKKMSIISYKYWISKLVLEGDKK